MFWCCSAEKEHLTDHNPCSCSPPIVFGLKPACLAQFRHYFMIPSSYVVAPPPSSRSTCYQSGRFQSEFRALCHLSPLSIAPSCVLSSSRTDVLFQAVQVSRRICEVFCESFNGTYVQLVAIFLGDVSAAAPYGPGVLKCIPSARCCEGCARYELHRISIAGGAAFHIATYV